MRILIVDDIKFTRDLVPILLERTEFPPVQVAASAEEALDILKTPGASQFDCFILDINMPEMNGIELCAEIRKMDLYRDTPIIMLTAKSDGDSIEQAFAAGANDYIIKRFDVEEFTNRIHNAERFLEKENTALTLDLIRIDPNEPSGQHGFKLTRSLKIAGIDRLIHPFSLGNYLNQIPQGELDGCQGFAVCIDRISDIYWYGNTYDLVRVLSDVANAVIDAVASPRLLMTYFGNGTFYCVTRGKPLPPRFALETAIRHNLEPSGLCTQLGEQISTSVFVGEPIVPGEPKAQRAKKTFTQALEGVSSRHFERAQVPSNF